MIKMMFQKADVTAVGRAHPEGPMSQEAPSTVWDADKGAGEEKTNGSHFPITLPSGW